jgi:hypothetical protein
MSYPPEPPNLPAQRMSNLGGRPAPAVQRDPVDVRFREMMRAESTEAAAHAKYQQAQDLLKKWSALPSQSVLMFQKTVEGGRQPLTFVALLVDGWWYTTGTRLPRMSWTDFVTWLVSGEPATDLYQLVMVSDRPMTSAEAGQPARMDGGPVSACPAFANDKEASRCVRPLDHKGPHVFSYEDYKPGKLAGE